MRDAALLELGFASPLRGTFHETRRVEMRRFILATILLAAWSGGARAQHGGQLEIWTRAPGQYLDASAPARVRVVSVALDRVATHEVTRADAQYDKTSRTYRVVDVDELLRNYAAPINCDVALLHFDNGMVIPLPFRDHAAMERLHPAVARAMYRDGKWGTSFPSIAKKDTEVDARPIRFDGNKLVVADSWHPDVAATAGESFSPWLHADSLYGIELVAGAAYLAQLDVDDMARPGFALFRQSCQFCHGARNVGAAFGWDFVDPLPIFQYRKTNVSLYYHVHYRASNKGERGLMMPPLAFITEDDAGALLKWLQAVGTKPLRPYAPPR
jgi:mono/diheme cytochrome c family protein